jgi:hypothetical protein
MGSAFFCHVLFCTPFFKAKCFLCPHEPLLNLAVPWVKKKLRNTALEDNMKMDLTEIRMEVVDWIHLAQYRDWW